MFRNLLTTAWRALLRNRLYAAINIAGLAVGFAMAILIAIYARDEFSYDAFIPNSRNIYDVYTVVAERGRAPLVVDSTSGDLFPAFRLDFPYVNATQINPDNVILRHGQIKSREHTYWADANVLTVLQLPVYQGNLANALAAPGTVVMTRRMAEKYFGRDDVVGKTIDFLRNDAMPRPMKIMAVLQDFPSSTNFSGEIFLSGATDEQLKNLNKPDPDDFNVSIQILASVAPADIGRLRQALHAFLKRHKHPAPGDNPVSLELRSLRNLHLMSSESGSFNPPHDRATIYAMVTVGALALLIAGINFVNLMTACAAERGVEVAIRKATGAARRALILQFVGESLLYAVLGMLFALALAELALPYLNAFLEKNIVLHYWSDPALAGAIIVLTLLVGGAAGLYPAVVMSGLRPAAALKLGKDRDLGSVLLREILVAAQFAILIGVLLVTIVTYQQTRLAMNRRNLGDQVRTLFIEPPKANASYVDAIGALPGVEKVVTSSGLALIFGTIGQPMTMPDGSKVSARIAPVDFGFLEFYKIVPVAGRLFSRANGADGAFLKDTNGPWHPTVILNERAVQLFGFASDQAAIGKSITMPYAHKNATPSQIISVVPDFNFKSVQERVDPTVYYISSDAQSALSVRLTGRDMPGTLAAINAVSARTFGDSDLVFTVPLNQMLMNLYSDLLRQQTLFEIFTGIAVFVSCMGLFALSAFIAQQRTKEIGIRKAMGADTADILRLLLWQFSKPVLLANLVAWPVAGFLMHRWLSGFAYRIALAPWMFLACSAAALAVALLTVSGHAFLVARHRPIKALRYE